MKHFLSVEQLTEQDMFELFQLAKRCREEITPFKKQLFAANLFFEPSTRTKMSFTVAERKLGLEILDFNPETSSVKKGETLYDTVRTLEAIGADLAIIRHHDDDWMETLTDHISIPIINAGAGKKEHPTQSMLDLFTIYEEFQTFKDLNMTIIGDIKHSRVAHSSAQLLKRLGANVKFSTPQSLKDESLNFPYISIDEAIESSDVLMLLRMQHERHTKSLHLIRNYHETYGLTKAREKKMKERAIILHPGPVNRDVEIDSKLVESSRSRIFRQMQNGVFIRMAVLIHILNKWGIINEIQINECQANC